jgi:hypothetical protein
MTAPDYAVSPRALDVTAAGIEAVLDGLRSARPRRAAASPGSLRCPATSGTPG